MYLAQLIGGRREKTVDKERNQLLTLLDLCAFAYSQDPGKKARRDLEKACRLAERRSLPEADIYRDIMRRLDREIADQEDRNLVDAARQIQDSISP